MLSRQYGSQSPLFPCTCCIEMTLSVMKMADEVSFRENSQVSLSFAWNSNCYKLALINSVGVGNGGIEGGAASCLPE